MEAVYGVPVKSDLGDKLQEEFLALRQKIAALFADGFQFSDLPKAIKEFIRSAVVIVEQIDLAGPDKRQIVLGALLEFYDSPLIQNLNFPGPDWLTKPAFRLALEFFGGMLIDLIVSLFNERVGGWPTGKEGA